MARKVRMNVSYPRTRLGAGSGHVYGEHRMPREESKELSSCVSRCTKYARCQAYECIFIH